MTNVSGREETLVPGNGEGAILVLDEPLSFWGGLDPGTGEIVDVHHPQGGAFVAGRVLVMPSGRGSSSSSSVLAEAFRAGTGPAAIVLEEPDVIIALGALVAGELYGTGCPVVVLDRAGYRSLGTGQHAAVAAGETGVTVTASRAPDRRGGVR